MVPYVINFSLFTLRIFFWFFDNFDLFINQISNTAYIFLYFVS
jgi:hypothetical protein